MVQIWIKASKLWYTFDDFICVTYAFLLLASVDTHCALAEIKDNIDGTIQSYAELITVQHSNSPRIPNLSMFHMEFFFHIYRYMKTTLNRQIKCFC